MLIKLEDQRHGHLGVRQQRSALKAGHNIDRQDRIFMYRLEQSSSRGEYTTD